VRRLLTVLFPDGIERYLDFACGTGRLTREIAPMARASVGVDISETMLENARAKVPGVEFIHADLTTSQLDLGEFDLISAFRFFGNADPELRVEALRVINQLQPIGSFLVTNNHRNPASLVHRISKLRGVSMELDLTPGLFSKLLAGAGYHVVKVVPIGAWMYRGRSMHLAGTRPRLERALERVFGHGVMARFAPDSVVLAQKISHFH